MDKLHRIWRVIDYVNYHSDLYVKLEEEGEYIVNPVPTSTAGGMAVAEMDILTNILQTFNDMFGNIDWKDIDHVKKNIADIPSIVSKDPAYQNAMKNSDKQNARIESERALNKAMMNIMTDNIELFKQFNDNNDFKRWLSNLVFDLTYNTDGKPTGESLSL